MWAADNPVCDRYAFGLVLLDELDDLLVDEQVLTDIASFGEPAFEVNSLFIFLGQQDARNYFRGSSIIRAK